MAGTPKALLIEFCKARDTGDKATATRLLAVIVHQNMPLVRRLSVRFANIWYLTIPKEDLLQTGVAGLLRGLQTYDARRSKLSSWCGDWIRHYLQELARAEGCELKRSIPASVMRAIWAHRDNTGTWPTVADLPGHDPKLVAKALMPGPRFVPFAAYEPHEEDAQGSHAVDKDPGLSPEQETALAKGVAQMDKRTKRAFAMLCEGLSPKEIARELNVLQVQVDDCIERARRIMRLQWPS